MYKNIILIHTARTWERIRLDQHLKEMPYDNIESVGIIISIADSIFNNPLIQEFVNTVDKNDFFIRKTGLMSDMYIEELATREINKML